MRMSEKQNIGASQKTSVHNGIKACFYTVQMAMGHKYTLTLDDKLIIIRLARAEIAVSSDGAENNIRKGFANLVAVLFIIPKVEHQLRVFIKNGVDERLCVSVGIGQDDYFHRHLHNGSFRSHQYSRSEYTDLEYKMTVCGYTVK